MSLYMAPDGTFPQGWGDIQRETPSWNPGDPLPANWREVAESQSPADIKTTVDEDNFRYIVSITSHNASAEYDAATGEWNEVWTADEPVVLDERICIAEYIDGEWVSPPPMPE